MSPSPPSSPPPIDFPPEPWRAAEVPPPAPAGDLHFPCPRCGEDVSDVAYGPCTACRRELRARLGGEQRTLERTDYVPKVNVTPNAVALKD